MSDEATAPDADRPHALPARRSGPLDRVLVRLLRAVTPPPPPPDYVRQFASDDHESTRRFLGRLPLWLDFEGKSVLDVGAGTGDLVIELARRGAGPVVGLELRAKGDDALEIGGERLAAEPEDVRSRVDLRLYGGDLSELPPGEAFDVVVSKDCFEHYLDSEGMVRGMRERLRPGGLLVVGFGPLWKAPYGGHIDARLPWAHLIFPERLVFEEYNRVRPGRSNRRYEDIGVARMTLSRFKRLMGDSGLECLYFKTNASDHPAVRVMSALARIPLLRELFTTNVYGVWRRPDETASGRA